MLMPKPVHMSTHFYLYQLLQGSTWVPRLPWSLLMSLSARNIDPVVQKRLSRFQHKDSLMDWDSLIDRQGARARRTSGPSNSSGSYFPSCFTPLPDPPRLPSGSGLLGNPSSNPNPSSHPSTEAWSCIKALPNLARSYLSVLMHGPLTGFPPFFVVGKVS